MGLKPSHPPGMHSSTQHACQAVLLPRLGAGHDGGADMGIVSLQGRITVSNANEMRRTLADALRLQPKELTVDLSSVSYMDTSGLATLMEAMRSARQQGTRLVLGSIQAQPRYLLKVTDLDQVFGVEEAPTT
jgi:anti-sigma B factor antagonist